LGVAICAFHEAGEQVILMMDCNEDIRSLDMKSAMKAMGLKEAITDGREATAQSTHQRNHHNIPIDGIFMSASLVIQRGGIWNSGSLIAIIEQFGLT
jgi:hypothetical protein